MYSLLVQKEAELEFNEAAAWYEAKQEKLGERFIDATINELERIRQYPEHFSKKSKEYREVLIPQFPF